MTNKPAGEVKDTNVKRFSDIKMLRQGASYLEIVDFPGTDIKIGIRAMTQDETSKCQVEAKNAAQVRYGKEADNMIIANVWNWFHIQKCVRALNSALEDCGPFFNDWLEVGQLQVDEQLMITEMVDAVAEKVSPMENVTSAEEFVEVLDRVKKKSLGLTSLSSATQRKLLGFLIDLLTISPLDSGSGYSLYLSETSKQKTKPKKKPSKKAKKEELDLGVSIKKQ